MSTEFTLPEGVAEQLAFVGKPLDWPGQDASLRNRATNFKSKVDDAAAELENLKKDAASLIPAELQGDPQIAKLLAEIGKATSVSQAKGLLDNLKTMVTEKCHEGALKENIEQGEMSAEAKLEALYKDMSKHYAAAAKAAEELDSKYKTEAEEKRHKELKERIEAERNKEHPDLKKIAAWEAEDLTIADKQADRVDNDPNASAKNKANSQTIHERTRKHEDSRKETQKLTSCENTKNKQSHQALLVEDDEVLAVTKKADKEFEGHEIGQLPVMAKSKPAPKDNTQDKGVSIV